MTTLEKLQDLFQRGILASDDSVLAEIKDSDKESRDILFGVYRHAYLARLTEMLGIDYPHLRKLLGAQGFQQMARAYIAAHPSDQRNARWFGRHVPDFLRKSEEFLKHPELVEVAALEKALNDAFDAPDAESLSLDRLAAFDPDQWPALVFSPHPSATRLSFHTNATEIWTALKQEKDPPSAERLSEPKAVIVWRQDVTAHFRLMPPEEAMMWDEALKGVHFGALCEMVATFGGEAEAALRAASYLKNWVDTGMLVQAEPRAAPGRSLHPV